VTPTTTAMMRRASVLQLEPVWGKLKLPLHIELEFLQRLSSARHVAILCRLTSQWEQLAIY